MFSTELHEFGQLHIVLLRGTANVPKCITHLHSSRFCSLNPSLSDVPNLHNPPRLAFAICRLCMYLFFVTKVLEINKVELS